MVRKMFEKAGLIPGLQSAPKLLADPASPEDPGRSKTAPGTMMSFLTAQSSAMHEAEALKERVKTLEGDSPLRKLDPSSVKPSKWANRHEATFLTAEFQQLKAEIAAAGGNVQPIKVRPVQVLNGSTLPTDAIYEVIFGHRRLGHAWTSESLCSQPSRRRLMPACSSKWNGRIGGEKTCPLGSREPCTGRRLTTGSTVPCGAWQKAWVWMSRWFRKASPWRACQKRWSARFKAHSTFSFGGQHPLQRRCKKTRTARLRGREPWPVRAET